MDFCKSLVLVLAISLNISAGEVFKIRQIDDISSARQQLASENWQNQAARNCLMIVAATAAASLVCDGLGVASDTLKFWRGRGMIAESLKKVDRVKDPIGVLESLGEVSSLDKSLAMVAMAGHVASVVEERAVRKAGWGAFFNNFALGTVGMLAPVVVSNPIINKITSLFATRNFSWMFKTRLNIPGKLDSLRYSIFNIDPQNFKNSVAFASEKIAMRAKADELVKQYQDMPAEEVAEIISEMRYDLAYVCNLLVDDMAMLIAFMHQESSSALINSYEKQIKNALNNFNSQVADYLAGKEVLLLDAFTQFKMSLDVTLESYISKQNN